MHKQKIKHKIIQVGFIHLLFIYLLTLSCPASMGSDFSCISSYLSSSSFSSVFSSAAFLNRWAYSAES